MYYQNQFNRRKPQKSFSVRLAKQLGIMLIFFVILLLFKFVDNSSVKKINDKIKEVFYYDMTEQATETFKNQLVDKQGVLGNLITNNKKSEFYIEFLPLEGTIISEFGEKTNTGIGKEEPSQGIKIESKDIGDVKAVFDGVVESVETGEGVVTVVIDHGNGYRSTYGYLSESSVDTDDVVKKGDIIGKSGKSSDAKTSIVYFQVNDKEQAVNPSNLLKASTN